MKKELQVAALENGTVIDHIPSNKLFDVVNLLHLQKMTTPVTIGYNLESQKMGCKGIIKVADKFFNPEEMSRLSVIAKNMQLIIIKNYEVVEKINVDIPDQLKGIVRCSNPKCICNNEPMSTHFHVTDKVRGIIKCHYCEKEQVLEKVQLI
jgi:aspartate carbamoyltransferase regulatory subunit